MTAVRVTCDVCHGSVMQQAPLRKLNKNIWKIGYVNKKKGKPQLYYSG